MIEMSKSEIDNAIGIVEEVKGEVGEKALDVMLWALRKQQAEKPEKHEFWWICPDCGAVLVDEPIYCCCGKKIDWT